MWGCPECLYKESMAKQPSPMPQLAKRLIHIIDRHEYSNISNDLFEKGSSFISHCNALLNNMYLSLKHICKPWCCASVIITWYDNIMKVALETPDNDSMLYYHREHILEWEVRIKVKIISQQKQEVIGTDPKSNSLPLSHLLWEADIWATRSGLWMRYVYN